MYTKISTTGMSREEWLRLRKTGIGGSDMGAVCGINPYSSAMNVFYDKISEEITDEDSESMRVGRDLEDYVARRFTEETGFKVRRSNVCYRSVEYPYMIADVDRLLMGCDAGLECKTTNAYGADQWKSDQVPSHYVIQCQWYMAVTGKKQWYIACLIMGIDFVIRKIERDEALIKDLITIGGHFWNHNVMQKIVPDADGTEMYDKALEKYFIKAEKGTVISLSGFDESLKRRMELEAMIGELEKEKRQIDQTIKAYMGENEKAANDDFRVSWSLVESMKLDTARLKEEKPEIYEQFLKMSVSRRFTVKAA